MPEHTILTLLGIIFVAVMFVFSVAALVLVVRSAQEQMTRYARLKVHSKGFLTDPFTGSYKCAYLAVQIFDETKSYLNPKGHMLWILNDLHNRVTLGRTYEATLYRKDHGWTIIELEPVPPRTYK